MQYCTNCNTPAAGGSAVCRHCGAPLANTPAAPSQPYPQQPAAPCQPPYRQPQPPAAYPPAQPGMPPPHPAAPVPLARPGTYTAAQREHKRRIARVSIVIAIGFLLLSVFAGVMRYVSRKTPAPAPVSPSAPGSSVAVAVTSASNNTPDIPPPSPPLPELIPFLASRTTTKPTLVEDFKTNFQATTLIMPDGSTHLIGEKANGFITSADGTAAAWLTGNATGSYVLHLFQNDTDTPVSGNVGPFYLAPISKTLYYLRFEGSGPDAALYSYANGAETLLAETVSSFAVSPSEACLLYKQGGALYIMAQGQPPRLVVSGKEAALPLSVSNDGTVILYSESTDNEMDIFGMHSAITAAVLSPEDGKTLAEYPLPADTGIVRVISTFSGTQLLLDNDSFSFWLFDAANGFKKFDGSPRASFYQTAELASSGTGNIRNGIVFANTLDTFFVYDYVDGTTQFYLAASSGDRQLLIEDFSGIAFTETTVLYTKKEPAGTRPADRAQPLHRITLAGTTALVDEILVQDVDTFHASDDLQHIYYVSGTSLYHLSGGSSTPVELTSSLRGTNFSISANGAHCLYKASDGTGGLYSAGEGSESFSLTNFDISSMVANDGWFLYYTEDPAESSVSTAWLYRPGQPPLPLGDVTIYTGIPSQGPQYQ